MPDFAAAAARIAARTFNACGDAAVLDRTATGARVEGIKALVQRGYQQGGVSSQRRLTIKLPIAVVGSVDRGDVITCEGERFEVQQELGRDQVEIELLVRELKAPEQRNEQAYAA